MPAFSSAASAPCKKMYWDAQLTSVGCAIESAGNISKLIIMAIVASLYQITL